jgi:hypothetical protein
MTTNPPNDAPAPHLVRLAQAAAALDDAPVERGAAVLAAGAAAAPATRSAHLADRGHRP